MKTRKDPKNQPTKIENCNLPDCKGACMESKHTPGPWKFNVMDGRGMIEGRDQLVAYVDQVKVIDGHLLAAAPELLEAVSLLSYHLGKWLDGSKTDPKYAYDVLEQAKQAIAKAEGR